MGPRSDERGNVTIDDRVGLGQAASMGPRSDERGNAVAGPSSGSLRLLQWGRALMSAEIRSHCLAA